MTRAAVREGFEQYVETAIAETAEEFSVTRAFRGVRGPGSATVDRLLKDSDRLWDRVVQPELEVCRASVLEQFDVLLAYLEDDEPVDAYRSELLGADLYDDALRTDLRDRERERVRDLLVERQRRFAEAIEPLVESEETSFWPAVTASLDRQEAVGVVEEHFAFTAPLRNERRAFRMAVDVDPGDVLSGGFGAVLGRLPAVEVEYTDEALRAMTAAERSVVAETKRELDARYE